MTDSLVHITSIVLFTLTIFQNALEIGIQNKLIISWRKISKT